MQSSVSFLVIIKPLYGLYVYSAKFKYNKENWLESFGKLLYYIIPKASSRHGEEGNHLTLDVVYIVAFKKCCWFFLMDNLSVTELSCIHYYK